MISVCNEWCGGAWQKALGESFDSDDEYHPDIGKLAPPNGVYACRVRIDGTIIKGLGTLAISRLWMRMEKLIFRSQCFSFDRVKTYGQIHIQVESACLCGRAQVWFRGRAEKPDEEILRRLNAGTELCTDEN